MTTNSLKYFFNIHLTLYLIFGISLTGIGQKQDVPRIETCDCNFKLDPNYLAIAPPSLKSDTIFQNNIDKGFKTECGYLIVPENRKKTNSKTVKLPFVIVKSKNSNKKTDPVFFTAGGPGISSLGWANGITKSTLILDRDCIAFEQRGTKYAIPYLRRFDLDIAMRESYRKNLPKDSMAIVGVKQYKKSLEKAGIDLSGYNTDETVSDIHDLLDILKIDSVNLFGGSYSGGLMLAVLQKDASKIRSLVLDSPLPTFVAIDEDEPANFLQALNVIFKRVENDSINKELYGNLKENFNQYFTSIIDKKFYIKYVEKGTTDTLNIEYTKNEILDFIVSELSNPQIPFIITEIIKGNHSLYARKKIDNIFNKNPAPDGMRISVYCADQANYNNEDVISQFHTLYPYMKNYHINDVYKSICDCWKVPPVSPKTKQPFYSDKPVLIGDGEMDQACNPIYMSMIKHYMPNAQPFLFKNRFHMVGGKDFYEMTQQFIDNPYRKVETKNKDILAY
ncbi:alpha/beta fold hydrolase [Rhabdobacter roseus]|uniref:Pimeloyl-ACP methyl ester carboxylesterase n=1 Tax=Rhabdobacter roseus TaxID=1655419 RepID=A0A840TVA0_9BACT|nr:alpha/beta fold hydrolase [Rhabdobacter roseus]MBB5284028.1 pimeloyl-ACP methyl ester carboxylesterase [Rhabdobacter roseus]